MLDKTNLKLKKTIKFISIIIISVFVTIILLVASLFTIFKDETADKNFDEWTLEEQREVEIDYEEE